MKRCPFCAEEIQDAAVYCRFCQKDLPLKTAGGIALEERPHAPPIQSGTPRVVVTSSTPKSVRPLPWVASGLAILVIAGAIGVALRSNRTFTGVTDSTPTTSGVPTVTRAETPLTPASASPESAALEKPLDDKAIKELLGTDPDWKPPPQISAERIFQDYSSNELAAERKYQKAFVVVGVVDDIGRQLITGEAYASLHGGNVQAWFHKDDEPELRTLKVGDRAMLLCLGGSGRTLGIVILKTCDRYR